MTANHERLDPMIRLNESKRNDKQVDVRRAQQEASRTEAAAGDLEKQIERLAGTMQLGTRGAKLNLDSLRQLDELMELLRLEQQELKEQADSAKELLEVCQDELRRVDRSVKTFERLKEIRAKDDHRKYMRRKRAA